MQDFDLYQYVGLTMNNVLITESGMIASMHLVGIGNLKISLEHNDLAYLTDGNGVCPLEYMDSFGGFNIYEAVY